MLEVRIQFLIFVGALIISAILAGLIGAILKGRDTRKTPSMGKGRPIGLKSSWSTSRESFESQKEKNAPTIRRGKHFGQRIYSIAGVGLYLYSNN